VPVCNILLPLTTFADVLVICEDDSSDDRYVLPWLIRRGGTYVLWASRKAPFAGSVGRRMNLSTVYFVSAQLWLGVG
jgi:hypothetical protein